jgi:non-specific serine/threonine protein kinase
VLAESLRLARVLGDPIDATLCVAGLATVAAARGQSQRAARLFGAAEALFEALGISLARVTTGQFEPYLKRARADLGEAAWTAAWAAGRALLPEQAVAEALAEAGPSTLPATRLSPREREVAGLIAGGLTDTQIASRLGMAPRTAETHVNAILRKVGVASRSDLAAWATTQGLSSLEIH